MLEAGEAGSLTTPFIKVSDWQSNILLLKKLEAGNLTNAEAAF
jgi:hypothetical protein